MMNVMEVPYIFNERKFEMIHGELQKIHLSGKSGFQFI